MLFRKLNTSGDYLSPNISPSGYYPNFPGTLLVVPSTANNIATPPSLPSHSIYDHWYACGGWDNQHPGQVRYSAENAFQRVLRHRPSIANTQYVSTVPSKTNDLWVQGATNWTQYVVTPVGTWMQLVANAPVGGPAGFYEMTQTDTTSSKYNTYQFNQGFNTMNYNADQVGRHTLYFVVNNQPSNVVVVDVFAQAPAGRNYYTPNGLTTTNSNGLPLLHQTV